MITDLLNIIKNLEYIRDNIEEVNKHILPSINMCILSLKNQIKYIRYSDVEELLSLYKTLNYYIEYKQFDYIDDYIAHLDIEKTKTVILIGILRFLFRYKDSIIEWNTLYNLVYKELPNRGLDPYLILKGLK